MRSRDGIYCISPVLHVRNDPLRMYMPANVYSSIIDDQSVMGFDAPKLLTLLRTWTAGASSPKLDIQNPHSWSGYVKRNPTVIQECFA